MARIGDAERAEALDGEQRVDEEHTLFVHLCSGRIVEVCSVSEVRLTPTSVVLVRGESEPATFLRQDVYFASCEHCAPPILI